MPAGAEGWALKEAYYEAVCSPSCTYEDIKVAIRSVADKRGWEVR